MLHALADLFAQLYDELEERVFRSNVGEWSSDAYLKSISVAIAGDVTAGRSTAEPGKLRIRLLNHDADAMRFAILRGLDMAFAMVNPMLAGDAPPQALAALDLQIAATGRLDSGAQGGALLPRLVERVGGQVPDHPRDAFRSVVRVPAHSWERARHMPLPTQLLFTAPEVKAGIKGACCPLIENPDEMRFEIREREGGRFYRIAPKDAPATLERVETVVEALHTSGAVFGILPELTLTPTVLERWQQTLRTVERGASRLRWIVTGSGDLVGGKRPSNTAVILDARTGEVVASQHKLFGFHMMPTELERWNLTSHLGNERIDEDLEPGRHVTIFEAGGIRLALLICEDLGRVIDHGPLLRDFGVSHVIAPVFGRPLKKRRWEQSAAENYARATGTTVVVANSRVMHRILGTEGATALVVWAGDALALTAPEAAAVAAFVLEPDGTARAA
jgi:predicted amidohydrolase